MVFVFEEEKLNDVFCSVVDFEFWCKLDVVGGTMMTESVNVILLLTLFYQTLGLL